MRYSTVWCVVVFGFFVCTSAVCPAKSVYLIGDTSTGRIQVYEIGDDELVPFQFNEFYFAGFVCCGT